METESYADRAAIAPPPPTVDMPGLPDGKKPIPLGSGVVTRLIRRGGTALVYEIWNEQLEVHRAVKLLNPEHDEQGRERFETEIKITAKLHHPNIVEIYAVGNWKGLPYIEMERVDGPDLESLLAERGALPVEVCLSIGIMISRALYHAHNHTYMIYGKEYHGIIHRDLKPANVMVTREGVLKLMDFGIAKPVTASARTMEGVVVGTMHYLAPEQLQGFSVDTRADIYAFGAVMYELLTGVRTFPEENLAKLVTDKLNNNARPIDDFNLRIPPKLKALVSKCLMYQKKDRIQSAIVLVKNLEAILAGLTSKAPEEILKEFVAAQPGRKRAVGVRNKASPFILVALVLLASAGAGFALFRFLDSSQVRTMLLSGADSRPGTERRVHAMTVIGRRAGSTAAGEEGSAIGQPASAGEGDGAEGAESASVGRSATSRQAGPFIGQAGAAARQRTAAPPKDPSLADNRRPPAQGRQSTSLAEQVEQLYATGDKLQDLERAMNERRYRDALAILDQLPASQASGKKLAIYRLKALQRLGDQAGLEALFSGGDIDDGEYYAAKALHLCRSGDTQAGREYYDRSGRTPAEYSSDDQVQLTRAHARALCLTSVYNANPTEEARAAAIGAWIEAKAGTADRGVIAEANAALTRLQSQ